MVNHTIKWEPIVNYGAHWQVYRNGVPLERFEYLEVSILRYPNADVDKASYEKWMSSVFDLVACRLV